MDIMKKRYLVKYERYYGELEDLFEHEIYANNIKEALLIIVAMLSDFNVETIEEAILKAELFINKTIREGWIVDDFFDKNILIETSDTIYKLHNLYEDENIGVLKQL